MGLAEVNSEIEHQSLEHQKQIKPLQEKKKEIEAAIRARPEDIQAEKEEREEDAKEEGKGEEREDEEQHEEEEEEQQQQMQQQAPSTILINLVDDVTAKQAPSAFSTSVALVVTNGKLTYASLLQ